MGPRHFHYDSQGWEPQLGTSSKLCWTDWWPQHHSGACQKCTGVASALTPHQPQHQRANCPCWDMRGKPQRHPSLSRRPSGEHLGWQLQKPETPFGAAISLEREPALSRQQKIAATEPPDPKIKLGRPGLNIFNLHMDIFLSMQLALYCACSKHQVLS